MSELVPGLYDELVDELLTERLSGAAQQRLVADIQAVDPAERADRVGETIGRLVTRPWHALVVKSAPKPLSSYPRDCSRRFRKPSRAP